MKKIDISSNKRVATPLLAYLVTGISVVMIALIIMGVYQLYNGGLCWGLMLGCLFLCVLIYYNTCYVWVRDSRLYKDNKGRLVYEFNEIVQALSSAPNKYTIISIRNIKRGKRNCTIYGEIEAKLPLRKSKNIKKCIIYEYTDEAYDFLMSFVNN